MTRAARDSGVLVSGLAPLCGASGLLGSIGFKARC